MAVPHDQDEARSSNPATVADRPIDTEAVVTAPWVDDDPERRFVVHNTATGAPLATVAGAGAEQVGRAIEAAEAAFGRWSAMTAPQRGRYLRRVSELIAAHADELATLESLEVGKPRAQASSDVAAAVAIFAMFADLTAALPSATRPAGHVVDMTTLVPFGVIGAIVPFNWPPIHTAGKTAPALAVGNSVVLKPPEQAPLTIMRMVELMAQVLPPNVVSVVPGDGETGRALASSSRIRKLSFTGAPSTGASVIKAAADSLTPTVMELGGKNPLIVFPDADIEAAQAAALAGGFYNQGEACTAASRLLIHRDIYDRFIAGLAAMVARLRVGPGDDPRTHIGPLVTRAQQDRVLQYLEVGRAEGARVAAAAPLPTAPELAEGYWVSPTLLVGVDERMRVAQEEIFGPVVVAMAFDDEADAVRIANGTEFGLVASVFTGDIARAMRISAQLDCGAVFVNNYDRSTLGSPFGGTKHSGYGREHAHETLAEFGFTRTVRLPSGTAPMPRWSAIDDVLATS